MQEFFLRVPTVNSLIVRVVSDRGPTLRGPTPQIFCYKVQHWQRDSKSWAGSDNIRYAIRTRLREFVFLLWSATESRLSLTWGSRLRDGQT